MSSEEDGNDAKVAQLYQDELLAQDLAATEMDEQLPPDPNPAFVEDDDESISVGDAAQHVMAVVKPVTVCLLLVIYVVRTITFEGNPFSIYLVYDENSTAHKEDSNGTKFGGALLNAVVIVCVITVMTSLFVALYKYRCLKVIYAWVFFSTFMLLGGVGTFVLSQLIDANHIAIDVFSFFFFVWNFTVVGLISIFWKSPLFLQQCYMVCISALMASSFSRFPEWTTWTLLFAVATYDIFAVLCPKGPLRILVETAQARPNDPIPGLLYSSGMAYFAGMATPANDETESDDEAPLVVEASSAPPAVGGDDQPTSAQTASAPSAEPVERRGLERQAGAGIKLGLGDFIFYSVLVARAAMTDWITVFVCTVALIMGLCLTLMLLGVFKKALPALPISIALGILFYFVSSNVLVPFVATMNMRGVYV